MFLYFFFDTKKQATIVTSVPAFQLTRFRTTLPFILVRRRPPPREPAQYEHPRVTIPCPRVPPIRIQPQLGQRGRHVAGRRGERFGRGHARARRRRAGFFEAAQAFSFRPGRGARSGRLAGRRVGWCGHKEIESFGDEEVRKKRRKTQRSRGSRISAPLAHPEMPFPTMRLTCRPTRPTAMRVPAAPRRQLVVT
jgi:hypothetical protein